VDTDGHAEAAAIYTLLVISSLSILDNAVGLMVATRRSLRLTQVAFAIWCLRFIFRILSLVSVLFMLVLSTEVRRQLPLNVEMGGSGSGDGFRAELDDNVRGNSMVAVTVLELVVALVHGWSLLVLIRDLRNQPRPRTVVIRAWKWFRETRWGGRGVGSNPYQGIGSGENNSSSGGNPSLPLPTSQNPSFASLSSLGMFYRDGSTLDEDLENVWASRASRANPETMSIRSGRSISTLGSILLGRASPEMVSVTPPGRSRASSVCSDEKL